MFDDVDKRRKRKTKTKDENERRKASIEKAQKKLKNVFKTNVLVPKTTVIRKGEGATVAASHLPFPVGRALFRSQAGPAAFFHGVLQTIGKTSLTTENVLPSTRNAKRETRNTKRKT
jgi:hypothetical protein